MAMTMRDITKSDGKIRFTSNGVKYEYIPAIRALWRIDGDNVVLANESGWSQLDHQSILNGTAGLVNLGYNPDDPAFGETLPAPKLDILPIQKQVLGKIPRNEKSLVRGIGHMPVMLKVNFDKTYKKPTSSNPFGDMPTDQEELLAFVQNAMAVFGKAILGKYRPQNPLGRRRY